MLLLDKAYLAALGSRISSGQFAAIPNLENKPTKVNGALSWSVPWQFVDKLFFNKGLISDLIFWKRQTGIFSQTNS
jgi:hypothetical protein